MKHKVRKNLLGIVALLAPTLVGCGPSDASILKVYAPLIGRRDMDYDGDGHPDLEFTASDGTTYVDLTGDDTGIRARTVYNKRKFTERYFEDFF